LLSMPDNVIL